MPARFLVVLLATILLTACSASGGVYHRVLPGQTLYSISRTYGIDERYLARINGINDPTQLQAGQQIYIPGADQKRRVPVTVASPEKRPDPTPTRIPKAVAPATESRKPIPKAAPEAPSPATRTVNGPPPISRGRFAWPLQGDLLKRFGSKSGGTLCKGLEIAATLGAPVRSAAAGKVIYSGDGISGYGNLIIVRHDNSFFTVYGYNQKNLVASGAFVSRGQQIARAGVPPKGGSPRLYFEIRYGKKPVDPTFYLP